MAATVADSPTLRFFATLSRAELTRAAARVEAQLNDELEAEEPDIARVCRLIVLWDELATVTAQDALALAS